MDIKNIIYKLLNILYYIIIFFVLIPYCATFLISVYNNFMISSISFTLDTLFLNWNTTFPSVTICEIFNSKKNYRLNQEVYGNDRNIDLDEFVGDISFFSGSCDNCYKCENISCPTNFPELIDNFRSSCEELFSECYWINKKVKCCDKFQAVPTEFGQCYSFNSMQAGENQVQLIYVNRETGPGKLSFSVKDDVQVYVHPTNDIPFFYSEGTVKDIILTGSKKTIGFDIMDIYNDPSVYRTTPEFRNCRFVNEPQERDYQLFRQYGYSTCIVECAVELQIELCGCQFFHTSRNDSLCGLEGLQCLTKNFQNFITKRQRCDCMSSCEEPEFNVIYTSPDEKNYNTKLSNITITMIELPTQRYVRNVVKTDLDLFISIGGIAGLFFGVSFISMIEIFYNGFATIKIKIKNNKKIEPK